MWLNNDLFLPMDVTYPKYNILKLNTGEYLIEISVPGREKEDISVLLEGGKLVIESAKIPEPDNASFTHKGISGKGFKVAFTISQASEVKEVKLKNGLLKILISKVSTNPLRLEVN